MAGGKAGTRWFKSRGHKIRTTADKAAQEYMTEPGKRRRNKSSFRARKKAAVTTIWLCFAAGKTCVACSYIILYGRRRRYPSVHSSTTFSSFAQYLEGLDLHRHKNVPTSRMLISPIARYHLGTNDGKKPCISWRKRKKVPFCEFSDFF